MAPRLSTGHVFADLSGRKDVALTVSISRYSIEETETRQRGDGLGSLSLLLEGAFPSARRPYAS